jgi:type IV pilus assembly protein PilF
VNAVVNLSVLGAALVVITGCITTGDQGRPKSETDAAISNVKLGVAYMQQGNLPLAKEKLERAEKQDPKNIEVHTSLAILYERLGRNEDAEREYQAALRLAPDSAEVANNYAVFLCRTGKVEPAIKLFETAAKDQLYRTPWAAHTNAGVCLRSNKRGADAVPHFERALAMRPDYSDAVRELGDLQLELGHPEISLNVVDRYLAIGRVSPDVLLVGVRAALARGDRVVADNYARRLRRDFPNSASTRALSQLLPTPGQAAPKAK